MGISVGTPVDWAIRKDNNLSASTRENVNMNLNDVRTTIKLSTINHTYYILVGSVVGTVVGASVGGRVGVSAAHVRHA